MAYIVFPARARAACALVAFLSIVVPARAANAQDDTLTLDEALRLAAERSQTLVAEDAAEQAARESAVAAAEPPDPLLTTGFDNVPLDGPDRLSLTRDFMTMRSIGIARELTHGAKRVARSARFDREAEAAEVAHTLALTELQQATAAAWFARYFAERRRDVLAAQHTEAESQTEAAELAYRNGTGSQSDIFVARTAVALVDDEIAAAASTATLATIRLARWIGDDASRPLAAPPSTAVAAVDHTNLEALLIHHPAIALMLKREEIARAHVDIARTERTADWSVALTYSDRGPAYSDMLSLSFSRPLQLRQRDRQSRVLAAALATAAQVHAEREEETREHTAETQMLLTTWSSHRERLRRYSDSLIPLARERTLAALTAYRSGSGTLSEVLGARAAEIETRLTQLDLEMATADLWAKLHYLIPAEAAHP